MTHPAPEPLIEVGIYDPSSRLGGSYWQWGSTCRDSLWEAAAGEIHQGWPMRDEIGTLTSVLHGAIRQQGEAAFWFYRVYPAGRDQFNRPGRYFFVLFRLQRLEDILSRQVSGVLEYFDTMRELPLKTTPLENAIPESPPDGSLVNLVTVLRGKPQSGHWGFDHAGEVIEFEAAKPEPPPLPPVLDSAQKMNTAKPPGKPCVRNCWQHWCGWLKARGPACLVRFLSRSRESIPPPPGTKEIEPRPNAPGSVSSRCPTCGRTSSTDPAARATGNSKDSRSSNTPKNTNEPLDENTP